MPSKKMRSKASFDGPLGDPIVRLDPLILGLLSHGKQQAEKEAIWSQASRYELDQKLEKLLLLARRYEIDLASESGWALLAFKIAEECISGFSVVDKPPRGRGRPKGSGKIGGFELVRSVDEVRADRKNTIDTVKDACVYLTRHKRKWKGENAASLEARYYEWFKEMQARKSQSNPELEVLTRALAPADGPPFGINPGTPIPRKK